MSERDESTARVGGLCAILLGLSFIGSAGFFLIDPVREAVYDDARFWETLHQVSVWTTIRLSFYAAGAVLAFGAIPALVELTQRELRGWVRWASGLAYLSFAVTAADNFRLLPVLPRIATAYVEGDAATKAALAHARKLLLLDPATFLKFGALGFFIVVVSLAARRAGTIPKGLAGVGLALGALSLMIVVGMYADYRPLIMFGAGLGGMVMLPVWFVWAGVVLGRAPPRDRP